MPKFFIKSNQIENNIIKIIGNDVNHIKNVLRLQKDDVIQVCNLETSINYECKINKFEKDYIECILNKEIDSLSESNIHINIFQGLPKGDKMELIIQKSVELGACEITPVEMKRCIVKLDNKNESKKINRWQTIAEVAAKQSGRDIVPKINNVMDIKNICNIIDNYDIVLLAYENEKQNELKTELMSIKNNNKELKIGVIIGPEGGIELNEVEMLKKSGAKVITLGNRILRTETVALVLTSIIMYELGNLGGNN